MSISTFTRVFWHSRSQQEHSDANIVLVRLTDAVSALNTTAFFIQPGGRSFCTNQPTKMGVSNAFALTDNELPETSQQPTDFSRAECTWAAIALFLGFVS